MRALLFLVVTLSLVGSVAVAGESVNGLPLHVERLGDNAIRLWVGDYISSTAVSALATDKGIVVIDSTESPALDRQFRKIIAKKFGRDDFVYLINTHEHRDHTTGNGVYSDCEIIAHENCPEGMQRQQQHRQRGIDWRKQRIPELEQQLAETEKGSDEHAKLGEELIVNKMVLESLESGDELTLPTKTFADRMTLDMGNMTLELYYMGGTHTASDIAVLVPEEGLLFTGDMMADVWLTDTPGCLQAFAMREETKRDMPLLLENWKGLIARKDEIRHYLPAHWNGELSHEGFVARYDYVDTLYAGIDKAVEEQRELGELFSEFAMVTAFPELEGTPGFTNAWVHNGSILALWTDRTGTESASNALASMIEEDGLEAAVSTIKTAHANESGEYYFLEAEFNALGYRYMGEESYPEAIAVFQLNVDLHPTSWNVYDSLGEAYVKSGQPSLAIRSYDKSLELNADNENGKRMLAEIQTTLAQE